MAKYKILKTFRHRAGEASLVAGLTVDTTEKDARLTAAEVKKLPKGFVELVGGSAPVAPEPVMGADLIALGVKAVANLDPENEDHVTSSGKPNVNALEAEMRQLAGDGKAVDVSAAERDAIWKAYQEANPDLFKGQK